MQKVCKKIIEKVKENAYMVVQKNNSKELGMTLCGFEQVIKEVEEEFATDTNIGSDGWIPVSESLPCESGYYLVTYHEWSNGDYLPKFDDTYVRRLHYQRSKHFVGWNYPHCVDERAEADTNREVIAWRKLPTPYQTKGE